MAANPSLLWLDSKPRMCINSKSDYPSPLKTFSLKSYTLYIKSHFYVSSILALIYISCLICVIHPFFFLLDQKKDSKLSCVASKFRKYKLRKNSREGFGGSSYSITNYSILILVYYNTFRNKYSTLQMLKAHKIINGF